jgi:hypothetical protein
MTFFSITLNFANFEFLLGINLFLTQAQALTKKYDVSDNISRYPVDLRFVKAESLPIRDAH